MSATGWQPDGSYVPCVSCGWEPPPDPPRRRNHPGEPVRMTGWTFHHAHCSTIPRPTAEDERKQREWQDENRRRMARARAEARNYVIG